MKRLKERRFVAVVEQELEQRLKQLRVHVDMPDDDTVLLRNVPANDRFFNKPRTNLLIKRPHKGMPYLICVDEDLDYTGSDSALARAFIAGHKQQGWRVLTVGSDRSAGLQRVVEEALGAVGFDGRDPELKPVPHAVEPNTIKGKLLANFAVELSVDVNPEQTIGREERIEEVVSSLLQWQVQLPLIVGESGVGKTNLVHAVAVRLKRFRPDHQVLSVEMSALMAGTLFDSERESLLIALLKEVADEPNRIVVMEHLEMALIGVPRGHLLLAQTLDKGARIVGTTLPDHLSRFDVAPLRRRLRACELEELKIVETTEILRAVRDQIAEHHGISIGDSFLEVAVEASMGLDGHLPAKAISLVDVAAARAAMCGERELDNFYLHEAVARMGATT